MRKMKWKSRAKSMLEIFISECGGEFAAGLVRTPGKMVRVDYLRQSFCQLARDVPSRDTFFFRSLPVDIEQWIRAVCTFDIDTYVPREWSIKHAVPRKKTQKKASHSIPSHSVSLFSSTSHMPLGRKD